MRLQCSFEGFLTFDSLADEFSKAFAMPGDGVQHPDLGVLSALQSSLVALPAALCNPGGSAPARALLAVTLSPTPADNLEV